MRNSAVLQRGVLSAATAACLIWLGISCRSTPTPPTPSGGGTLPAAADARSAASVAECRWTDEPIVIDGKGDEEAWKHAQPIEDFQITWAQGAARKPHTATKARLLWDREYLYFLADMQDTDLYADITEHDGQIYLNDVFELFFKPADDKPGYYEFEVSSANTTMELFIPARGSGGYDRYKKTTHIKMETAVALRGTLNHWQDVDEGWSVEGRIPWRDMAPTGGRPNVGEVWKFALCRGDYSVGIEGPELTTSAPLTLRDFHHWEDYAPLRFTGPVPPAATQSTERSAVGRAFGPTGAARPGSARFSQSVGFDTQHRVPWTNSHVVGYPDPPLPFTVAKAWPKFKVKQPLYLLEEPGTDNLLLLQHLGSWSGPSRLLRMKNTPDVEHADVLLEQDRLTLGMTLHPDFLKNGYIYLHSNGPITAQNKQDRISRFTVDRKPPYAIDPKSELVILEWDSNGHNGGDLAFGPDGYLYHASGDGSSDSDADLRGQDITHLNSAMLRIDVDHPTADKPYSIPPDNPFLQTPGARPEIWAYGFRNPWRLAFDRYTGQLWVGQNGQDMWEQVYLVRRGENYGWSVYEGSHPFNLNRKQGPTPITPPTVEHSHAEMRSLTGGVVYYGSKFSELKGCFIYGDWSTGRIWAVRHDGQKVTFHQELARTTLQIGGFREMRNGDLVVIDQGGGLYTLERAPKDLPTAPFPTKLSDTGLFVSVKDDLPAPGLIPYSVNSPLWADGASKERFMAIPGNGTADVMTSHGWSFPEGTVLVKTFSLDVPAGDEKTQPRRIETRLLTKQLGQWAGYSYVWNDEQTDATLVPAGGEDREFAVPDPSAPAGLGKQTWHYPSRTECMVCHTRASNFVLGTTTAQLNRDHDYGTTKDNQLRVLERLGVLHVDYMAHIRESIRADLLARGMSDKDADQMMWDSVATRLQREPEPSTLLPFPPEKMARLPDPYDSKDGTVEARARSYLSANCAICHITSGGGNSLLDLDYTTPLAKTLTYDVAPQHETFGIKNARVIAPGQPDQSVLYHRITMRGSGQMPPLATSRIDPRAKELLKEWISGLTPSAAALPVKAAESKEPAQP
jgi:glucose/arabinose dehydrogenase/mono/diheme cytochrome c family protein